MDELSDHGVEDLVVASFNEVRRRGFSRRSEMVVDESSLDNLLDKSKRVGEAKQEVARWEAIMVSVFLALLGVLASVGTSGQWSHPFSLVLLTVCATVFGVSAVIWSRIKSRPQTFTEDVDKALEELKSRMFWVLYDWNGNPVKIMPYDPKWGASESPGETTPKQSAPAEPLVRSTDDMHRSSEP